MADAPTQYQWSAAFTHPHRRAINNEYHIELAAKGLADIRAGQIAQTRLQFEAAAANQRALGIIHDSIIDHASSFQQGFKSLSSDLSWLSGQLDGLEDAVVEGFDMLDTTLHAGFGVLAGEICSVSNGIFDLHATLRGIAENFLSKPNETEMREVLKNGTDLLRLAAILEGREKIDTWKDALLRFRDVTNNKIGATNPVVWFNIGWTQWQLHKVSEAADGSFFNNPADFKVADWQGLQQAEQSFYNAQRFSAETRDMWHTRSLRHQAEMQYLQGRHQDAWNTANKALAVRREYDTLYDAARYASKLGRASDQEALLDECIELRSTTIITMFSEEDFLG